LFILADMRMEDCVGELKEAAEQYFSAKHAQASIELEQLQLQVAALKSLQSPILPARFNNQR